MKKILIALVVLVGFAGTAAAQTKVGHVKSQMLWDTLQMSKTAEQEMRDFQGMLAEEIQGLEADLADLYTQYQDLQAKGGSPTMLSVKQRQIESKEQEYQKRQQSAQFEMQAYRVELEAPIQGLIREAVELVAKREKYDYIMDVNSGLYVNPDNDVTDVVMMELLKLEQEALAKAAATNNSGDGTPGAQ